MRVLPITRGGILDPCMSLAGAAHGDLAREVMIQPVVHFRTAGEVLISQTESSARLTFCCDVSTCFCSTRILQCHSS